MRGGHQILVTSSLLVLVGLGIGAYENRDRYIGRCYKINSGDLPGRSEGTIYNDGNALFFDENSDDSLDLIVRTSFVPGIGLRSSIDPDFSINDINRFDSLKKDLSKLIE